MSSSLDLHTVMDRIDRHAKDLLIVDTSAIFVLADDGDAHRAVASVGRDREAIAAATIEPGDGIVGAFVASGQQGRPRIRGAALPSSGADSLAAPARMKSPEPQRRRATVGKRPTDR